ncbi:GNAT family N-acetyltransferase [Negadavirga shengliensis]|uniref:GNAT family N-acetyltransferase n=1 Tax=Negadavirga shengliensis TaxID=1389218 RepID=A0ABV9T1T2_9BACT
MDLSVSKVDNQEDLKKAFRIREEVFVHEQLVAPDEEYDEFENSSVHFLAYIGQQPVGTARWRMADKGVKLERFAVLKPFRDQGIGQALVKAVLEDINNNPQTAGNDIYMHAQVAAVGLYRKFGFEKVGEKFMECNIEHYLMKLSKK